MKNQKIFLFYLYLFVKIVCLESIITTSNMRQLLSQSSAYQMSFIKTDLCVISSKLENKRLFFLQDNINLIYSIIPVLNSQNSNINIYKTDSSELITISSNISYITTLTNSINFFYFLHSNKEYLYILTVNNICYISGNSYSIKMPSTISNSISNSELKLMSKSNQCLQINIIDSVNVDSNLGAFLIHFYTT